MAVKTCPCPLGAVIGDLEDLDCPAKFGQIGKIAFQIRGNAFTDITDEAEWTTAIAALDSTKVQMTPILHAQETTPAEPTTVGGAGSNEVYNGTVEYVSDGNYQAVFTLRNPSPAVLKALKAYECEVSRLGVYMGGSDFVLSNENMGAIPVTSLYVQDSPSLLGNENANLSLITLVFKDAGWFSNSLTSVIDFDFTTLVNA